jgi:5-bromo-4-chloroindolyl phosphate hydrolysis protein
LSLAFLDWRRTLALTLAGAVGFGIGLIVGVFVLQGIFGVNFMVGIWGTVITYALTGTIGERRWERPSDTSRSAS